MKKSIKKTHFWKSLIVWWFAVLKWKKIKQNSSILSFDFQNSKTETIKFLVYNIKDTTNKIK